MKHYYRYLLSIAIILSSASSVYAQCNPINNERVSAYSFNSISVVWDNTPATSYEYRFVVQGGNLGTATIQTTNTNGVTLTGLSQNTTYAMQVREVCSGANPWSGFFLIKTACGVVNTPFTGGFNGPAWTAGPFFNSIGTINSCWLRNPSSTGQGLIFKTGPASFVSNFTGAQNAFGGSGKYMQIANNGFTGTADSAIFESPLFDLSPLSNPELSFQYHFFGAGIEDMEVYISNDFGASYQLLQTISGQQQNSGTDAWKESLINLSAYANDTVRVRFIYKQQFLNSQNAACLDEFKIAEAPSCPRPTNFNNVFVGFNSARFQWLSGGASNWQLSYGSPGFTPSSGTIVSTNSNPGNITGLSPNTNYEVYVRDSCGPTDLSAWTGPIAFRTACSPLSTPYSENFSGNGFTVGATFNAPGTLNSCWSRTQTSGYFWKPGPPLFNPTNTGPNGDKTTGSGQYLFTETTGFTGADSATLESPLISLAGLTAPQLSFWTHMFGVNIGSLKVYINNGSGWSLLNTQTGQQQSSKTAPWLEITASLSAYVGDTIMLRFVGSKSTVNGTASDIAIDDLNIDEAPSCPKPNGLSIVSAGPNSVQLSWTSGGANNWQIEYGSPGFGQGTGTIVNANSNPFTVTGLSPNTTYQFYVRDSCGAGDVSAWSNPVGGRTPCTVFSAPYTENFDGNSWQEPQFFNQPGQIDPCWTRSDTTGYFMAPNSGNSNVFNSGPDADNTTGSGNYVYSIIAGFANASSQTDLISPLIDLSTLSNPELRFYYHMFGADIDRLVVAVNAGNGWSNVRTITGQQQSSSTAAWTEEIVSLGAYLNDTIQVRFRAFRSGSFGFSAAIALDDILVDEVPSCPRPSNFTLNSSTTNSLVLSWTTGGATNWQIQYRPIGSTGPFTIVNASSNPFTLSGLNPSTSYEIFVRDSCGAGDVSRWEGPLFESTACGVSSLPYYENFDNLPWQPGIGFSNFNDQISPCWTRNPNNVNNAFWGTKDDNTGLFQTGPDSDVSGNGNFIHFVPPGFGGSGSSFGTIRTGEIALVNAGSPYLYYQYHMFGSNIQSLQIRLNTRNNGSFLLQKSINGQQQTSSSAAWILDSIDLSSYVGDTIEVVFRAQVNGFRGAIAVDEVRIESTSAPCGAPINFNVLSTGYDSIQFNFSSINSPSATFLRWYDASLGAATATTVNNVGSPYTISGLSAGTNYVIELFDSCGSLLSDSFIDTLTTLVCPPVSASISESGWFLGRSFTSSTTNADTLTWYFGTGDSSKVANPNYIFPAAGTYQVQLVASNDCGDSDTAILNLQICDTLRANFQWTVVGDSTIFTADTANNATGYSWDLDEGFFGSGPRAAARYTTPQDKFVTLTAWNDCGDTVTNTRRVEGCLAPKADWTYTILSPINAGLRIQFDGSASTNATNFSWDFGDGNTGTGLKPIHIYNTPGLFYEVTLTVTNSCGLQDVKKFRLNQLSQEELELADKWEFELYPVPAHAWLNINLQNEERNRLDHGVYKIFSLEGKLLMQGELNYGLNRLAIGQLARGSYLIKLDLDGGSLHRRFIVKAPK